MKSGSSSKSTRNRPLRCSRTSTSSGGAYTAPPSTSAGTARSRATSISFGARLGSYGGEGHRQRFYRLIDVVVEEPARMSELKGGRAVRSRPGRDHHPQGGEK